MIEDSNDQSVSSYSLSPKKGSIKGERLDKNNIMT
jgi:hypothetical protein